MPRKRDRVLGWFTRSRNASPSSTVQRPSSSDVDSTISIAAPSRAHPRLLQAGSSGVVLPAPQTTPSRDLLSTESGVKDVASVAWEGVKTALVLLKESSDWFPPLKSATGIFLALIDVIEVSGDEFFLDFKPSNLTSLHPAMWRNLNSFAKASIA